MSKRLKVIMEKVEGKDYYKTFLEGREDFVKIVCEETIVSTLKRSPALFRAIFNLKEITKKVKYHINNDKIINPLIDCD